MFHCSLKIKLVSLWPTHCCHYDDTSHVNVNIILTFRSLAKLWVLLDFQSPAAHQTWTQRNPWSNLKLHTDILRVLRCASISWFDVVSWLVIHTLFCCCCILTHLVYRFLHSSCKSGVFVISHLLCNWLIMTTLSKLVFLNNMCHFPFWRIPS